MEEHARCYTTNQDNSTPKHSSNNSTPWKVLDYSLSAAQTGFLGPSFPL